MSSPPNPIRQTPSEISSITKDRIEQMDAFTAGPLGEQAHQASVRHQSNTWTTPGASNLPDTNTNVENRPANNDYNSDGRFRRLSFGGNDGRGGPFFSSLTKMKRTDNAAHQEMWEDQFPVRGPIDQLWRKYVSGKSPPNRTYSDLRRKMSASSPVDVPATTDE